jgi:hypothetical protein
MRKDVRLNGSRQPPGLPEGHSSSYHRELYLDIAE